jgi:hypothetical protein
LAHHSAKEFGIPLAGIPLYICRINGIRISFRRMNHGVNGGL